MEGATYWDHELFHNKMDTWTNIMTIEKLHMSFSRSLNFSSHLSHQPLGSSL